MGLQREVNFAGDPPAWDVVRERLLAAGLAAVVKMIDGLPAFPDESPDPGWTELRVGVPHGMVTLRRSAGGLSVVVWGNADAALLAERDQVVAALADATGGSVSEVGA